MIEYETVSEPTGEKGRFWGTERDVRLFFDDDGNVLVSPQDTIGIYKPTDPLIQMVLTEIMNSFGIGVVPDEEWGEQQQHNAAALRALLDNTRDDPRFD